MTQSPAPDLPPISARYSINIMENDVNEVDRESGTALALSPRGMPKAESSSEGKKPRKRFLEEGGITK